MNMEFKENKGATLSELMQTSMSKVREMVDSNTIIGQPITTPDGVTLIPVSRLSFGFGCGGGDYGKQAPKFGGASTAGVRVEPVAFLVIKDGVTRVLPVAMPAVGTFDRVIDMVPEVMDRVENFIEKRKTEKEEF
jgi:sporulation protein YtfJ